MVKSATEKACNTDCRGEFEKHPVNKMWGFTSLSDEKMKD